MGLIEKLKLLFLANKPATDIVSELKGAQAFWKTIPFWVTLIGPFVFLVAALKGVVPVALLLWSSRPC